MRWWWWLCCYEVFMFVLIRLWELLKVCTYPLILHICEVKLHTKILVSFYHLSHKKSIQFFSHLHVFRAEDTLALGGANLPAKTHSANNISIYSNLLLPVIGVVLPYGLPFPYIQYELHTKNTISGSIFSSSRISKYLDVEEKRKLRSTFLFSNKFNLCITSRRKGTQGWTNKLIQ